MTIERNAIEKREQGRRPESGMDGEEVTVLNRRVG